MPMFLSVREAAQLTGKSPSSIRRVLYPIIQNDNHGDREQVQPGVEEALRLRLKGESFAWRLSEEFLRRVIPVGTGGEPGPGAALPKASAMHGDQALLDMLRRELEIKNEQITQQSGLISKQMELISGLSERLREGNVLMGSLQQRLALSGVRDVKTPEPLNAKTAPAAKAEKGRTMPPKPAKARPRFLSRLFH